MLVLDRESVTKVLDLAGLIDRLGPAMAELSAGQVSMAPRALVSVPGRDAFLGAMPAFAPSIETLAAKLVTVFPHNTERGIESHHAVIVVFDPADGRPAALLDGTHITAARTAAGSALATRLLARDDASVLAILGTGVQARFHALAIPLVRAIRDIRIAGRSHEKARALAQSLAGETGIPVGAASSFEDAVRGADIVCATTHSSEPVLEWDWLAPGAHVNSVGVNPAGREIGEDTVANAYVAVESRDAVLAASGANEILWPIRDGRIDADHIMAEIGELVSGAAQGRTSPDEVTLYKSVGVAVQDAVAARMVLDAARAQGLGVEIDL